MRKIALIGMIMASVVLLPTAAFAAGHGKGAGGVTGPAFYVDGELYRTVVTPTNLSNTGAPDHSFDVIYDISEQTNVATAAPGDEGYNGGRWRVRHLEFSDYEAALEAADANASGDLDSASEIEVARTAGLIMSDEIVASFVCPVIPVPNHG